MKHSRIYILAVAGTLSVAGTGLGQNLTNGPYDVVVPLLNGDPATSSRVSGQLYYDVSAGSFKGIDSSGNVQTLQPNLLWTQSSSNIYYNTGNVGINTTSPTQKLDVNGTIKFGTGGAYLYSSAADNALLQTVTNTPNPNILIGYGNGTGPGHASVDTTKEYFVMNEGHFKFLNGSVGIGLENPSTALQVAGVISPSADNTYTLGNSSHRFTDVYATNGTIQTSDRRQKKDIEASDLGLSFIQKLQPVSYHWISGSDVNLHYGLIAQDTEQAILDSQRHRESTDAGSRSAIVTHDLDTDTYGMKYSELISPIIQAIKELSAEVSALKKENAELRQRIK